MESVPDLDHQPMPPAMNSPIPEILALSEVVVRWPPPFDVRCPGRRHYRRIDEAEVAAYEGGDAKAGDTTGEGLDQFGADR
jgi:hypothetical protein